MVKVRVQLLVETQHPDVRDDAYRTVFAQLAADHRCGYADCAQPAGRVLRAVMYDTLGAMLIPTCIDHADALAATGLVPCPSCGDRDHLEVHEAPTNGDPILLSCLACGADFPLRRLP